MSDPNYFDWLLSLHDELQTRAAPIVRVIVAGVRGSAPREAGACMLISASGETGTIGGGHLEFVATRTAREMLASPASAARLDRLSLGASLGQCCGGIVELWFQRYDATALPFLAEALQARRSGTTSVLATAGAAGVTPRLLTAEAAAHEGADLQRHDYEAILQQTSSGATLYEHIATRNTGLWLFGAGHVARALVHVMAPLPFDITWVDSREGFFPRSPPPNVRTLHSPAPADEVGAMHPGDWALVTTHSHDEDFSLCQALLQQGHFAWAGVIGSAPKTKRFHQRLAQRGFTAQQRARLTMPIGIGGIRSKEAAAIAVSVAAQLLQVREAQFAASNAPAERSTGTD